MSGRLPELLDRLPSRARRGLMIVMPLALLGLLVAGFVLAPRGPGRDSERAGATGRLLPPALTTAAEAPGRPLSQSAQPAAPGSGERGARMRSPAAHRPSVRGPVSEQPPAPPPQSAEGTMLAVARRFAVAYMPYQVGRLHQWARTAIERTCTPAFARYLLAQPAQPTLPRAAHPQAIETYKVASVEPAAAADAVAVAYVSEQDSADTGEFLLRMVEEHGRWLVARLEA